MARRKFKEGMIVWARVPDRSGILKTNPRPLVILSLHPTDKTAPFLAGCVSTRPAKETDEPIFELPWDAQTGSCTGFYERCALVLRWQVIVDEDQVDPTIRFGQLPKEMFAEILRAIEDARTWR
jgi:hypothetical protein